MITNCKLIWAKGLKSRFVNTASGWTKPRPNPVLKAPEDTIQTLQCEITIFLDGFMSFSHYWGGFCVHFNNVAHFTEVWGRLFALPQCFSQVEIQTFQHISLFLFQTFLLPKNFPSRGLTRFCFVFKRVLTPCFVDQNLCSPDFYLETQIKVGLLCCGSLFAEVQVPPRWSFPATAATMWPIKKVTRKLLSTS